MQKPLLAGLIALLAVPLAAAPSDWQVVWVGKQRQASSGRQGPEQEVTIKMRARELATLDYLMNAQIRTFELGDNGYSGMGYNDRESLFAGLARGSATGARRGSVVLALDDAGSAPARALFCARTPFNPEGITPPTAELRCAVVDLR